MSCLPMQRAAAFDLCRQAGVFTLRVASDCMGPGIPAGARVQIACCTPAALAPGDVVLLRLGGQSVLHRYLGAWRHDGVGYLVCKADRRRRPDRPWPAAALVGRAVGVEDAPAARVRASSVGERVRIRLQHAVCWLGLSVGLLSGPCAAAASRLACQGRVWGVEVEGASDALPQALARRLAFRTGVDPDTRLRIVVGPDQPPSSIRTGRGPHAVRVWAESLALTLDTETGAGEVFARDAEIAAVGVESFFRIAAMEHAVAVGGVCLHASAAACDAGVCVFAGPSGAGKTTAAHAFGADQVLDEDFVLLEPRGQGFARAPWLPTEGRGAEERPVLAVCLPAPGPDFDLERVPPAEAVARCFHVPPIHAGPADAEQRLAAVGALVERVPVFRLHWRKGIDLADRLTRALAR